MKAKVYTIFTMLLLFAMTSCEHKDLCFDHAHTVDVKKAGETYNLEQPYYWPGGECKMKFFAYAPKGDVNYKFSEKDKVGSPLIDITIPKNVAHQKDLLVAQSGEVKSNAYSSLPLTFNHALTAVRFICGDDMAKGEVTTSVRDNELYLKAL